ncbi:receptor-like serine/threonine-protein kinase SD1-8 [Iris pallida]|uniref:Receptor-like serine/threonine-protein kinase n=1 Tax=Iris pallida TaxID=29817 RepID=A0AAX6DKE5_IRIPA|nr:receptor-like serine/threonine-protein kinase SD1-8 [Iris pallida]
MKRVPFLLVTLFAALCSTTAARDTVTPTQPLLDNETLVSSAGHFALGFFTPANSSNRYVGLWYNKITVQTILWVANRANPVKNSTGLLSIDSEGTLKIADSSSTVVWSVSNTGLDGSPVAQLLDTGNFVVRSGGGDSSGSYAWQGFDYPTDSLIPGMKLGVDKKTGLNRNLTAWKSDNDPSPGVYCGFMNIRGDPEIYLTSSSSGTVWRTGPWDGVQFSGIPDTVTYQGFSFSFLNDDEETTYSYYIGNQSVVSRLVVNQSGLFQRSLWLWESNQWNFFWYAPKDPCDDYKQCGPYGACDPNSSPMCGCLVQQAFSPKNPANWALRDGSDGCVRNTALDCRNGTDGFVLVRSVKLPQASNATVDTSLSLDQCHDLCLNNCSCTAYATANVTGGGSGCIIWVSELIDIRLYVGAGQDIYVRVAAADIVSTPEQSHKSKTSKLAVALSLILGVLLLALLGCFLWRRKKRRRGLETLGVTASFNDPSNAGAADNHLDLPLFDFGAIAASTNHFSEGNKLGEGGFGPVYKGKLEDTDQDIAVKRLARTSVQGLEEFKNEVVLIAKLQHRNLVRLLGCCIQGEERMLIYEYMPNKSLDAFLFDKQKGALLDWRTRYQIILGIARGLLYLHQDSRFRIIHRDLKASNILLDKDMDPKISDFGMARIFGGDETDFNTRKVVGTYGYMSPEYAMDGVFSVKSDVFSFGVLVLEIVSGKKNRGVYSNSHHVNLLSHAWSLWKEGKSMQLVDESMSYSFSMDEVIRCIKLGLLCVQERPEDRPLMSSVILMLGSDIASLPQPKQPGFAARRGPFETESSSSKQNSSAVNDMTLTMLECR